jgi:hypothetical protein
MRYPLLLSALAAYGALLSTSGCIQPEYPDSFDEAFEGFSSDASQILPAYDAGADAMPGAVQNPLGPLVPNPTSDAGSVPPLDAAGVAAVVDAGAASPEPLVGRDAGARVDAAPAQEDAGSAPSSAGDGPSRCTITASTDAADTLFYAGKYGCAVWISSASNKLVKSFFAATRIASRSGVPTYKSESAGLTLDVVAGATLSAPKQHQYTWMLTDASGAKVAPGKFALKVEIHSSNGVELVSVPFDTTVAPVSEKGASGQIRSASIVCE